MASSPIRQSLHQFARCLLVIGGAALMFGNRTLSGHATAKVSAAPETAGMILVGIGLILLARRYRRSAPGTE